MKAHEIIEAGWCKDDFAQSASYQTTGVLSPTAARFCMVGALCKKHNIEIPNWSGNRHPDFDKLSKATGGMPGQWNDTHTKEECVALLKELDL